MEVTFQITLDDYISASLLSGEMTKRSRYIHYIIDILLIILGISSLYYGKYIWAGSFIGAAIGGNLLPYGLRKFFSPWYLRRHYNKYKVMKKPLSISLLTEGIQFKSESGEGFLKWQEIHHWREGPSMILIYLAPRIYYIIPKKILEQGFPIEELKTYLFNHLGKSI